MNVVNFYTLSVKCKKHGSRFPKAMLFIVIQPAFLPEFLKQLQHFELVFKSGYEFFCLRFYFLKVIFILTFQSKNEV